MDKSEFEETITEKVFSNTMSDMKRWSSLSVIRMIKKQNYNVILAHNSLKKLT